MHNLEHVTTMSICRPVCCTSDRQGNALHLPGAARSFAATCAL